MELEKKAEEKQRSSTDLKRKMKHDEISNVKKQSRIRSNYPVTDGWNYQGGFTYR